MEALVEKLCNRFSGVTGVCSPFLIYPLNLLGRILLTMSVLVYDFLQIKAQKHNSCLELI